MKIAHIVRELIVTIKCTFHRFIEHVDITGRSSAMRRQTMVGSGKQAILEQKNVNISKTVGDTSMVIIND